MRSSARSRFGFIDAIRGVAACLVMLQHSLYQSGLLGNPASAHFTGFIPSWLELGETGVVAFFIVSGFVIPLSLETTANLKLFWLHRALRIYPLYLVAFIVTFAIENGGDIHSMAAFLADFSANLLFIQEYLKQENFVGGSWTLSMEIIWYTGISVLAILFFDKKTVSIVAASVLLSLIADAMRASGQLVPMGRLSMLLCCVLGLVSYRWEAGQISRKIFASLSVALIFSICLNLYLGFYLFPGPRPSASFRIVTLSWSLAAIVYFLPFFSRRSGIWGHPVFGFLGRHSYSIYLLHPIVLYAFASAHVAGAQLIAVTFVITISLSMLTYRFIESPPIRLGHRLKQRPRPSPRTRRDGEAPTVQMLTRAR
jgi:peptidoglycan/LPS O-acetylase OafA/YrhL